MAGIPPFRLIKHSINQSINPSINHPIKLTQARRDARSDSITARLPDVLTIDGPLSKTAANKVWPTIASDRPFFSKIAGPLS